MHLNQQSCVIFSIFARTSSSKDNYFCKSGCNSQCSSFSQNTHTHHTPRLSSHMPLNWKLSFGPPFPKPSAGPSLYLKDPFQLEINWILRRFTSVYFQFFHHEMNKCYPREISSQDTTGGLLRLPGSSENVKRWFGHCLSSIWWYGKIQ